MFYAAVCNKYSPVRAAATGTDRGSGFLVAMQLSRPSCLAEGSLGMAEKRRRGDGQLQEQAGTAPALLRDTGQPSGQLRGVSLPSGTVLRC